MYTHSDLRCLGNNNKPDKQIPTNDYASTRPLKMKQHRIDRNTCIKMD